MMPILLIAQSADQVDAYTNKFISKYSILPFYIFRIEPIKTEVTIDQIRSIKKEIITQTATKRLFICKAFDTASLEAQNAFLKTLEEKQESNYFILVAQNQERVLPTIRSRSVIENISTDRNYSIDENTRTFLDTVSKKNITFFGESRITAIAKEDCLKLFDEMVLYFREKLQTGNPQYSEVLKKIFHMKDLLQYNNLNPQMAIDSVLLFITKTLT